MMLDVKKLMPQLSFRVSIKDPDAKVSAGESLTNNSITWLKKYGIILNNDDESYFRALCGGQFATLVYPHAYIEGQQLISDFICICFIIDDMFDNDVKNWKDGINCSVVEQELGDYLETGDPDSIKDNYLLCQAMFNLRQRIMDQSVSDDWYQRFVSDFRSWIAVSEEEAGMMKKGMAVTPEDLIRLRPDAGACYVFMNFIDLFVSTTIDEKLFSSQDMLSLRKLAGLLTIFPNDLLSYQRETASNQGLNFLTALQTHEGKNLSEAATAVIRLHNSNLENFEELAAPYLEDGDSPMALYLEALSEWDHGLYLWGLHAERYGLGQV
ncbi:MAG: hypothetical protein GY754_32380 [bacterium]|nr:hypothetical protein [bacterium]